MVVAVLTMAMAVWTALGRLTVQNLRDLRHPWTRKQGNGKSQGNVSAKYTALLAAKSKLMKRAYYTHCTKKFGKGTPNRWVGDMKLERLATVLNERYVKEGWAQ